MKLTHYYHWFTARRRSAPDPIFKAALLNKLIAEAAGTVRSKPAKNWGVWRMSFAVLVGLIVVGSISSATYAYNNPAVTAGTPLYPLKRNLEKVEEKLQRTPEQKVSFDLKQINRREAEAKTLLAKKKNAAATELEITKTEKNLERHTLELRLSSYRDEVRQRLEAAAALRLKQAAARQVAREHRAEVKAERAAERMRDKVDKNNYSAVFATTSPQIPSGKKNTFERFNIRGIAATSTISASTTSASSTPSAIKKSRRNVIKETIERLQTTRQRTKK